MKKYITFTDSIGKTVDGVYLDEGYDGVLIIAFTDETYARVYLSEGCYDASDSLREGELSPADAPSDVAIWLGFTTQEEVDRKRSEETARVMKYQEDRARQEYERLKARFEGKQ